MPPGLAPASWIAPSHFHLATMADAKMAFVRLFVLPVHLMEGRPERPGELSPIELIEYLKVRFAPVLGRRAHTLIALGRGVWRVAPHPTTILPKPPLAFHILIRR